MMLPLVGFLYLGSFFARPRKRDKGTMQFLRLHFISFAWVGEILYILYELNRGIISAALVHFLTLCLYTVLFHYSLQLRASIGRLPDKDLSAFLVEVFFMGGLRTLASVLFITFRTCKCGHEVGIRNCETNTQAAMFISNYLLGWWVLKLVHGSIEEEGESLRVAKNELVTIA